MKIILYSIIVFFISGTLLAENEYPLIVDSKTNQKIGFIEIGKRFLANDILIIGEEHDDDNGHVEKLRLIKFLSSKTKFSISMEMFEKDQQIILDEFLSDLIEEKTFAQEIRGWSSMQKYYGQIVRFAKENKFKLIASNTPRRYSNLVMRNGLHSLWKLPQDSFKFLPPLHSVKEYITPEYQRKCIAQFHMYHSSNSENLLHAQALWDASMADSVFNECKSGENKVIHINGRFHSDDGFGVTYRLKKTGLRILTISMFLKDKETSSDKDLSSLADIVYFTGERK